MRVVLVHTPSSGEGRPTREMLVEAFERRGHRVTYASSEEPGWEALLAARADAVVAAGGDGTARRVAVALADRRDVVRLPLALLPLGTANNIARTVGINGSLAQLADELDTASEISLAVGLAKGPWGARRFVESAGIGFIAALLERSEVEEDRETQSKTERVEAGLARLERVFRSARARRIEIEADGRDLSGEYLLVEAMNIRSIGPGLLLAPGAHIAEQRFNLVLATEADRPALARYLASLGKEPSESGPLEPIPVRALRLGWPSREGHLDDMPWPSTSDGARATGTVAIAMDGTIPLLLSTTAPSEDAR